MTLERRRLMQHEERLAIYYRDRGICQACGEPVDINEFQVAHKIAQTIANYKRWGRAVIDLPLNKATTHPGPCNDRMNCGMNPVECEKIARMVREGVEA